MKGLTKDLEHKRRLLKAKVTQTCQLNWKTGSLI